MKFVWAVLAVILLAIILHPPDFERPTTVANPQPSATAFHPNARAKSLSAAPGAIVCPNFASVRLVFSLYASHWEDAMQDAVTQGQATVLRGASAPAPDPALYGCSLLKPGTAVYVENTDAFTTGIPIVSAQLPDGSTIRGVTLPGMLGKL
jgi:hypothetical protein